MDATAMARAAQAIEMAARESRETLDLQGLGLEELPPLPAGLPALRRVELGGNRLRALPPALWQATALETLGLAGNRLRHLDPGIGRLQQLQKLDLSANLLSTLPDELAQCVRLTHLNLSANQLHAVPPCLARLIRLHVLNLRANRLESAILLGALTELEELLLDDNALTEIPAAVRLLPRLRVLSARANPLQESPPAAGVGRGIDEGKTTNRGFGFIELPIDWKTPEEPFGIDEYEPLASAAPTPLLIPRKRGSLRDTEQVKVKEVKGRPMAKKTARAAPPPRPIPPSPSSPLPKDLDPFELSATAGAELPEAPVPAASPAWAALPSQPRPSAPADPVDAAVFCPPLVARESVFLVQVFVYPPGAESTVEKQARQADAAAERRGIWSLPLDVPRGTCIDLRLEMPGLVVAEPDARLVWRGAATAVQFEVEVPAGAAGTGVVGRVRFAIDGVPAGTLRFQVALVAAGAGSAAAEPQVVQAQRYRRAFVSYSSKDRAEVLRRVQAFKIAGMTVFQDILDLDPGERWERALYREIDGCDVFLLFWSRAAADSPWVAREIDYALARKAGDEDRPPVIQPVPIEGPPIVPPPPALGGLHFNDALLAQIAVAEAAKPIAPS